MQKGHKIDIIGAFSLTSLDKAGTSSWKGIRIFNITPIIMMSTTLSLIFNIVSSIFTSILMFIILRPKVVIISVPDNGFGGSMGSYIVAKLFRTKIITDYRDEWEDYTINIANSQIYKKACKSLKDTMTKYYLNSDLVITVTERLAHSLSLRGIRKNVTIVTNGADCSIFKPYDKCNSRSKIGFNENDFILVYSGGVGWYYRLDVVVAALKN